MPIKYAFIISFIIGALLPFIAGAQIKISEVMYDPAGTDTKREWIEVFNAGAGSVDLTQYFLFENNVYHKLTGTAGGILAAGAYAVIADSVTDVLQDYPEFDGLILDSAFSLGNTGETISMANPQKEIIDTFIYTTDMGGVGTGHSLQINGTDVITAGPTFATENKTESERIEEDDTATTTPSGNSSGSGSDTSSHHQQEASGSYTPTASFKLGIGRNRIVSVHAPIELEALVSKADLRPGIRWNMGDFGTDAGRTVTHIYDHPGTYQVIAEARLGGFTAVSRTEVDVRIPQLAITQATDTIVIANADKAEVNIGDFVFHYISGNFKIPQNTIIAGSESITLNRQPDQILRSVSYPDGTKYAQYEDVPALREQLMAFCQFKPIPLVCKTAKVREYLVQ